MGKLRPFCEAALEEINNSQDHSSKHVTFEQWVDQLDFGDRYWTKVKEELVRVSSLTPNGAKRSWQWQSAHPR